MMIQKTILTTMLVILVELCAAGQQLPDPALRRDADVDIDKLAGSALEAGYRARERGDLDGAYRHFLRVLRYDPWHSKAILELLSVSEKDPDARALWAHAWYAAAADDRGRARPDRKTRKLLPANDPYPERLVLARAAAARELSGWIKKARKPVSRFDAGDLAGRWAAGMAWELLRLSPPLLRKHRAELNAAFEPYPHDTKFLVDELQSLSNRALAKGDVGTAVKAARCLKGLASQARFNDIQGPRPPDLAGVGDLASGSLEQARKTLRDRGDTPLTVDQLQNMNEEERERFTREHAGFDKPGVAISPNGLYRIETICGFDTLLGAARTVELHHGRLANWYGRDPFGKRQGIVRIVPEHSGLESEGVPHWWAGGFQRGDVTTVRFAVGNIEGLGGTLTHELTHRFDGTIFPFLPAWLVEGRAVWTGHSYGHSSDTSFVPNYCRFGTIENAMFKGYGARAQLEKLITGTIGDYRDNYVAGYALYVYLSTWEEEGVPVYKERFERFMREIRKGRSRPLEWFKDNFCDGKTGRPEDFGGFVKKWNEFLRGFHWLDRAKWVDRYATRHKSNRTAPWVYDGPTWVRARNRAEPFYGQDQALLAGNLFLEKDQLEDAARAWLWSLGIDDWTPGIALKTASILENMKKPDAAWLVRAENARQLAWVGTEPPAPWSQLSRLPRLAGLVDAYVEAVRDYRSRGQFRAAAVLSTQHDRIARYVGLESVEVPRPEQDLLAMRHPFDEPERLLGLWDWSEEELTGYEEHRVHGLWYLTADAKVHVGRFSPRKGTGEMDRTARLRHIFVRGNSWERAGRYRVSTRVNFTTTYVSGAVVLGWGRRDRNVRFSFTAGDFLYSAKVREKQAELDSMAWNLRGLRDRDPGLWGSAPDGRFGFERPKSSFQLDLFVDGPEVRAWIDGICVGSYHTLDGLPIEGYVGFAAQRGAYRVDEPVVQRLDHTGALDVTPNWLPGLEINRDSQARAPGICNRRCRDIPLSATGTVVIWIPPMSETMEEEFDPRFTARLARRSVTPIARTLRDDGFVQKLVVAIPEILGEKLVAEIRASLGGSCEVVTHRRQSGLNETVDGDNPDSDMPSILFVDPIGVLRSVHTLIPGMRRTPWAVEHWLRVFRERANLD